MLAQLINLAMVEKMRFSAYKEEETHIGGGVYRIFDKHRKVIYVGKSNDLHKRIHAHLNGQTHTKKFTKHMRHVDWHRNDSPIMQTLLEGILIAYYKPKHNDEVKDEEANKKKQEK